MIDLESDLEELHDSEQRWAAKHKRAIEQVKHWKQEMGSLKHLRDSSSLLGAIWTKCLNSHTPLK